MRAAGVGPDDVVLEIGPGLGSLTLALLDQVRHVVAVEVDERLATALPATIETFAPTRGGDVDVLHADALQVTELPGPAPTALVANLPYNISVPVLLHFFELVPTIERGLVMVQAEVADRLAAGPGSRTYGVPSLKSSWYADVRPAGRVGRNVFWPAPNVDSGLVAWTRHDPPADADRSRVFAVVDAAFAQRRKTLRAALAGIAGGPDRSEAALVAADVSPQARGEQLDLAAYVRIAAALDAAAAEATQPDALPE